MISGCVVKLVGICNIDCDYCYMYHLSDQSFRSRARFLSVSDACSLINSIIQYCAETSCMSFELTLHGGEPLLWPVNSYRTLFDHYRSVTPRVDLIHFHLQTNLYTYPNDETLGILQFNGVTVGVSVDGPKDINDRHRRTRSGKGTYDRVIANVERLATSQYRSILSGFLCVIDPHFPPTDFLDWMSGLPVTYVDVLLPIQFTHRHPPWGEGGDGTQYALAPDYGKWIAQLFEEWTRRDDERLRIRLLEDVLRSVLSDGKRPISSSSLPLIVLNTDGQFEHNDFLRNAFDGAMATGMHVSTHSLAEVAQDPVVRAVLLLGDKLPSECAGCPISGVCGGGFLPGRLSGSDLDLSRRSILCADEYYAYASISHAVKEYRRELQIGHAG